MVATTGQSNSLSSHDVPRRRAITVRIPGVVITIRSVACAVVFAAAVGVAAVAYYGNQVRALFEGVVAIFRRPPPSSPPPPQVKQPTESRVPPPQQTGVRWAPQPARVVALTYRPVPSRLRDRDLPLRAAPNQRSTLIISIQPHATGIRSTGRIAYYPEPGWQPAWPYVYRLVLWREVRFQGVTGWVCDYYIELE